MTDCGAKAAGKDTGVKSAMKGVFGGKTSGGRTGSSFAFGIIYQSLVMAIFPKVHSLGQTEADVSRAANSWSCLKNGSHEN
jgi:hypothetical protein